MVQLFRWFQRNVVRTIGMGVGIGPCSDVGAMNWDN
jgi:hypothetical protein